MLTIAVEAEVDPDGVLHGEDGLGHGEGLRLRVGGRALVGLLER